jgi:hypothetical protein
MPDIDMHLILHGVSNLPEDRFINTLHFSVAGIGPWETAADVIAQEVLAAYAALPAGFFSAGIQFTATAKLYNPEDSEPRPPRTAYATGMGPGGTSGPYEKSMPVGNSRLPSEVALCLSYYTDQNIKRKRGRIYLGPLNTTMLDSSTGRPSQTAMNGALALATRLSDVGTEFYDWQLVSRVNDTRTRIEHAWVDDAFDTQRRRGIAASTRVTANVSG